jgi:hypothetical protein
VLTVIACPECHVPAEITELFSLTSTDAPVEHVVVHCAAGHHFRMPVDRLPAEHQQQLAAQRQDRADRPALIRLRSRRAPSSCASAAGTARPGSGSAAGTAG